MPQTIENKLSYRIRGNGGGWAFSPRDFLDMGERSTVDSALHRLTARGEVRRVIRGIYDYPRFSKLLEQQVSPAMNLLGLSTQVPGRVVYLSDGPDRSYKIDNTTLAFEHTALKEAGFRLRETGLIVQALKSLGEERVTPEVIERIREWLPKLLRSKVLADARTATTWVYKAIQDITQEDAGKGEKLG